MKDEKKKIAPVYVPTVEEAITARKILDRLIKGRDVINRSYNQFEGGTLFDRVDDWTKRWNGHIPESSILLDVSQFRIFLNYTRNAIISYLSNVAVSPIKAKIKAVNKKSGLVDQAMSEAMRALNDFSNDNENQPAKFLAFALETTVKGTAVAYEGYMRQKQRKKTPIALDPTTGKIKYKKELVTIFDDCFQEIVPIEDFYIANPYQPDVQKQPWIIWKKITSFQEAKAEFGHYANFEYVVAGAYTITAEPTTYYRNSIMTDLGKDEVDILRYYHKTENRHVVMINGIVIYDDIIPFKDGNYPFAVARFEPFDNFFFWGAGYPYKIQGEQDAYNTNWNMVLDKQAGSLLPYGLSSDLDDIVEDNVLEANKIRKVGDINKWKFDTLPGVSSGELGVLQTIEKHLNDYSGIQLGSMTTARGGKLPVRQVLIQQQENMKKIGYSLNFLEDFERDRTILRINHIRQFYTIPKIEKITAKNGREIEQIVYRDFKVMDTDLSDGRKGTKVIKFVNSPDENEKAKLQEELSVTEAMGEEIGTPTEAIAMDVSTIDDWDTKVQVVKNSSFEKNSMLDQAARQEYADWRFQHADKAPVDGVEVVKWVDEAYDIDSDRFTPKNLPAPGAPGAPTPNNVPAMAGGAPGGSPMSSIAPGNTAANLSSRI